MSTSRATSDGDYSSKDDIELLTWKNNFEFLVEITDQQTQSKEEIEVLRRELSRLKEEIGELRQHLPKDKPKKNSTFCCFSIFCKSKKISSSSSYEDISDSIYATGGAKVLQNSGKPQGNKS